MWSICWNGIVCDDVIFVLAARVGIIALCGGALNLSVCVRRRMLYPIGRCRHRCRARLHVRGSGLLGLVDSSAYSGFVSGDWTYEQLLDHFNSQMKLRNLLVWECGDGGDLFRVKVKNRFSDLQGWRNITGSITPTNGYIHLTSYSSLTMAAQFNDVSVPAEHEKDLKIKLENKPHKFRIIQNFNPETVDYDTFSAPHFIIEIEEGQTDIWSDVAWETNRQPE